MRHRLDVRDRLGRARRLSAAVARGFEARDLVRLAPRKIVAAEVAAVTEGGSLAVLASDTGSYSNTVWGGRLRKRFCSMFSGSSPFLLRQHGSCSSAQLPVELSENMLQKRYLNLQPHSVFDQCCNGSES